MNLILIEDEDIAMRKLRAMITEADRTATICAELSSVEEAMAWFGENLGRIRLDVIISDIQLSDGLSFEVFEAFALTVPIIFTTAYNDYALQAFKVHGLDYLLKPIRKDDLKRALEKFYHNKLLYSGEALREVQQLLGEMQRQQIRQQQVRQPITQTASTLTFLASSGNRIIPLSADKIAYFFVKNQIVRAMHENRHDYALDETLEEIESRLPPDNFFRATRQYIVNRKAIVGAEPSLGSRLLVHLQPPISGEAVIISREKVSVFKAWLQGESA